MQRVTVTAVRGRGGEGVGAARGRVTVTRDLGRPGDGREAALAQEGWQREVREGREEDRMVAEVRGARAREREAQGRFLKERLERGGMEVKQTVRLVEDMRSAGVVRRRGAGVVEVVALDRRAGDKENLRRGGGLRPGKVRPRPLQSQAGVFSNCSVAREPARARTPPGREGFPGGGLGKQGEPWHLQPQREKREELHGGVREEQGGVSKMQGGVREVQGGVREVQGGVREVQGSVRGVQGGVRELEHLLGSLGSLDSTEEVSASSSLSTIQEGSERDSLDCVPVRGPTPAEDSLASSASPFPSSRLDSMGREESDGGTSLDSVTRMVARVRQQRELLERRQGAARPPQEHLFLSTVEGGRSKQPPSGPQYKLNTDFIKKVLDFSRSSENTCSSSSTTPGPDVVRVNVVLDSSSPRSPSPSPISKPAERRAGPQQRRPEPQHLQQPPLHLEKQAKLRYYVEKLLQMKHEDIEALTPSTINSASSSGSRKQVRFREERGAPSRSWEVRGSTSWLSQTADTTLYRQMPAPPAKQLEAGPLRGLEVEVQDSVSRHTSELLLTRSTYEEVSVGDLQAQYRSTRERLQEKLSVISSRQSPGSSLALSAGLLSPLSREGHTTTSSSLSHITFSELEGSRASSVSSGTATLSHIDLSEDGTLLL